jgi:hypothetical protein
MNFRNKLVFVLGKPFQPSLMIDGKALTLMKHLSGTQFGLGS